MINVESIKDANIKRFVSHVIRTCIANNIDFVTIPVDDDSDILGGFNDSIRTLEITESDSPNVIGVLVHEYSHMMQWIENAPVYIATYKKLDPTTVVDYWLKGKEYSAKTLDECFLLVKKLEFDCDKRAVQEIIKWKLPIDLDHYKKSAIAYSYYYDYLRQTRKQGKNVPYESDEVLQRIIPDFSTRDLAVRDLIIEELIDKNNTNVL
jgi:hypothetical protein